MSQNSPSSVNDFSKLHAIFGFSKCDEKAEWFWVKNKFIPPTRRHDYHFDPERPDGRHPLLVLDKDVEESQPTSKITAHIRSATSRSRLSHEPHPHSSDGSCKLNRQGWFLTITTVVEKQYLNIKFCSEPLDSPVISKLRLIK